MFNRKLSDGRANASSANHESEANDDRWGHVLSNDEGRKDDVCAPHDGEGAGNHQDRNRWTLRRGGDAARGARGGWFVLWSPQASQTPRRLFSHRLLNQILRRCEKNILRFWRVSARLSQERKVDLVLQRYATRADVGARRGEWLLYSQRIASRNRSNFRLKRTKTSCSASI